MPNGQDNSFRRGLAACGLGRPLRAILLGVLSIAGASQTSSAADDGLWSVTTFAGFGIAPDSLGADEYEIGPGVRAVARYRQFFVEASPNGGKANLIPSDRFQAGPVIRRRGGRNDVDDPVVDRLSDVNATIEVGGFVSATLSGITLGAEVTRDVLGEHDGFVAEVGVRAPMPLSESLTLTPSLGTAIVSEGFAETYFGVDAANAARSGLSRFDADGGIAAVSAGLSARHGLSDRLAIVVSGRYARLLGDAADTPIVAVRGSADQFSGQAGLSYRF